MNLNQDKAFWFEKIGQGDVGRLLAVVVILVSVGCNSKISSKLVATKVIVPPEQGSEIERDGVTVSVPPGTFSYHAEIDVEVVNGGIKITSVTATGTKVLSANVLKDVSFCSVIEPSFDRNNVYVQVEIKEDQAVRTETIPNSAIEFRDISGQTRACWHSKYVNAFYQVKADRSPTVGSKLTDPNCIDPDLSRLANDEVFTLCDGSVASGSLDLENLLAGNVKSGIVVGGVLGSVVPAPGKCTSDGAVGCVTTASFPAADKKAITAADLKAGKTIAGIAGAYVADFPDVANVYNDTVNGVTGTLTLPAAASVRTTNGTFGQGGTGVTPTLADCSADGGTGCVAVTAFKAADMANVIPAKIMSGVTIAGVIGDYPSATNPLVGADGTADLTFATFDAKIKAATNFEWFDSSGTRYVNSGDADIVDSNILTTANIFGTQGTITAPTPPDAWDIRVGRTINGVAGKLKVACRNSANTADFDAGEFKNATADSTNDFFTVTSHGYADNDTIRFTARTDPIGLTATTTTYYVRFSTADTFQLATISGGSAIDFTTDGAKIVVYKWGGSVLDIWDTVDDYNNNGTVFTVVDTPAAWSSDNFCGGAGTANSSAVWMDTTTDGSCDSAGDQCRFKDRISGLEWSELQSASTDWGTAMTTCANLSFGGAGAWRLPTQKELMAAYEHGIYTAQNANWLTKTQMDANYFWSSSTRSDLPTNVWVVNFDHGNTNNPMKNTTLQVVCVR